jgi:hypothetical protein
MANGLHSCRGSGTAAAAGEMSVEMGTSAPNRGDFLPPELMHLLGTARRVIDQHINDQGHCAECGSVWPCQRALLAELALGAL